MLLGFDISVGRAPWQNIESWLRYRDLSISRSILPVQYCRLQPPEMYGYIEQSRSRRRLFVRTDSPDQLGMVPRIHSNIQSHSPIRVMSDERKERLSKKKKVLSILSDRLRLFSTHACLRPLFAVRSRLDLSWSASQVAGIQI